MKRIKTKEIILCVAAMLLCKVGITEYYPFIVAYFTILYLETEKRFLALAAVYLGMAVFLPITQLAKYGIAVIAVALTIQMIEWVNKNCRVQYAAIAASGITFFISVGGGLLTVRGRGYLLTDVLEAVFIYGVVVLGNRLLHMLLHGKEISQIVKEREEEEKEQRLLTYAESFNGLSQAFAKMSSHDAMFSDEVGQIQNEIAGKICVSCNMCQLCWAPAGNV